MPKTAPMLHLFCGKIAAGKSTLAAELAQQSGTVLIAEDAWLGALFSDQMATGADYLRVSEKLRRIMGPHVASLLKEGASVVLDFPANTVMTRRWMRSIIDAAQSEHRLHVLIPPDQVCLDRLRERNAAGNHPFAVTEAQFHQFSKHFEMPTPDERFALVVYDS